MYRDDYIMRMIRQFGQVITYVLGLRRRRDFALALISTDEALRDRLGIGSEALAERSEREILALIRFRDREGLWREEAAYIAALLYAEAAIYAEREDAPRSAARALRALQLLAEAALDAADPLPDYAPPRAELLALLRDYAIPARTRAALLQLCEQQGDFAGAEDQLFHLLDEHPGDAELRGVGLAFYERLLARDDAALAAGGLPRAEARAGLAEVRSRGEG